MFTLQPSGRGALATALAMVLIGAAPSVASATDRHLTNTGTDSGDCAAAACATLEYAQQQVQAGDAVRLAAGVYPVGDATFDVDDVTYERNGPGEAKITLPGDSYGIQVNGNDVTFRHLTVSSSDDTIQGDTWAFTYKGSDLTLDHMLVGHMSEGVVGTVGGHGITVKDSTFIDVNGTNVGVTSGQITATDNVFSGGGGIYVTEQATVAATGNDFRGNTAGDGGHGIYVDGGSAGGTVTGNRFSPSLENAIDNGDAIQAPNNWWGCNEGVENAGCVANYALSAENAEPHLVLGVSADPNPFLMTGSSTITTSFASSDPESTFVGGPTGAEVALTTSEGTLDNARPVFVAGVAQTALRHTVAGFPLVTATLDNASATTTVEAVPGPEPQSITFTSDAPTAAKVGGSYSVAATGGASGNPVTFSVDATSTVGACTVIGTTAWFTGAGTCTVNANQAGSANYTAADQKQQSFQITKTAQVITLTSTAPTDAVAGGTYDLTATGGASGNPVTFSVDATSTAGACTVTGATVSFTGVGTCTVNADQAGNASYTGAAQERQTFGIGKATQAISFTSTAPTDAVRGGSYGVTATGGATGNPVTFSIDASSTAGACTIDGITVSFTGAGTCTVNANQAGNANYTAAAQEQQTFTITEPIPNPPGPQVVPPVDTAPPSDPVPPADVPAPAVHPLTLSAVRTPVRCLTYGAAMPKKRIALRASAQATVGWTIKKVRGSKATSKCPPARNEPKRTAVSGKAKGTGSVKTNATGAASVALSTLLPAKVRRALKPGLYRVAFVARNATGSSPERVVLIRVLKQRR